MTTKKYPPTVEKILGPCKYLLEKGLSVEEIICLKWRFRLFGSFYTRLIELIAIADEDNRNQLAIAFPPFVLAYNKYAYEEGFWQKALSKAHSVGFITKDQV